MRKAFILIVFWISLIQLILSQEVTSGSSNAARGRIFYFPGKFLVGIEGTVTGTQSEYPSHPGGGVQGSVAYFIPGTKMHSLGFRLYGGSRALFGIDLKKNPDGFKTIVYNAGLGAEYLIETKPGINPFFFLGLSYFGFDPMITTGRSPNNRKNLYNRNSFSADLELGVRIAMSENIFLKLGASLHPTSTDYLDDIKENSSNDLFYTGMFGISLLLGGDKDKDKDGIKDKSDACPEAPEDMDGFEDTDGCPDPDNDHDGIADHKDKCPDSPEDMDGYEDSDGCPEYDNDMDGINDQKDTCADLPEDFDGYEDTDGCPDYDNDKDGILDKDDKCPNSPENFNEYEDTDGCPDTKPSSQENQNKNGAGKIGSSKSETLKQQNASGEKKGTGESINLPGRIMIHGELTFEPESALIKPQAKSELNRIAEILRSAPESRWRIEGYMDNQGDPKFLNEISEKRALAVLNYLVSRGLSGSRFKAAGMGSRNPIETNDKAYGRMMNRRVVLVRIK